MTRSTIAAAVACICLMLTASPTALASQPRQTGRAGAQPIPAVSSVARGARHRCIRHDAGCKDRPITGHTRAKGHGSRSPAHRHGGPGRNSGRSGAGNAASEGAEEEAEEGKEGKEGSESPREPAGEEEQEEG
jgi:hypothetical protein